MDSFEVGSKGSLMGRQINFSVAVFHQKYDGFLTYFTGIYYESTFAIRTANGST